MSTIPHLHIDRTGLALWDDVPVGEYRIITLHEGPAKGKDVLVQKLPDGKAAVHLHPQSVAKSFSLSFPERMEKAIGSVRPLESPPPQTMPTQIAHTHDMKGNGHYVPLHSDELHPEAFPIGAKLPAGHVRTRNGYVHALPSGEYENAQNGVGKFSRYKSLNLPSAKDRKGIYDHPVHQQDYRHLQDMDDATARQHLDDTLAHNGAINGAVPSPTGDWHHAHSESIGLPSDENGTRKDVIPHIPSALMNPAEVWERQGPGGKERTHFLYPKHDNEGEEGRFPYGIRVHSVAATSDDDPQDWNVSHVDVPSEDDADKYREGRPVYIQHHHGEE